jgi:hypothetical protein
MAVQDVVVLGIHLELVDHLLDFRGRLEACGLSVDLLPVLLPALEGRPWDAARPAAAYPPSSTRTSVLPYRKNAHHRRGASYLSS